MKNALVAAFTALSLGFCTTAMAKDLDAIDLFVGDFAGVGSIDFDKLVANKMVSDAVNQGIASNSGVQAVLDELKASGIDYKKDIDTITIALTEKGRACAAVDAKVSLLAAVEASAKKMQSTQAAYNELMIFSDANNSMVLLNDKRLVVCENKLDIKPIIDNAKAEKPKTLKDRDKVIYDAYQAASKSADIRIGAKMTSYLKEKSKSYSLKEGDASIAVSDIDSGSVSISFAKGLNVVADAKVASDAVATSGAAILNAQINGILSDPSLNEIGLGFVKDAVKIAGDKKNIKATVSFTDEQMTTLMALAAGLDTSAVAPKASVKKAAPKAAPKKAENADVSAK